MPNPAIFVQTQSGNCCPLPKPDPCGTASALGQSSEHLWAEVAAPAGTRTPSGLFPSEDSGLPYSPFRCLWKSRAAVFTAAMVRYLRQAGRQCPERADGVNRTPRYRWLSWAPGHLCT